MSEVTTAKNHDYIGVRLPLSEARRLRELAAAEDRSLGYLARRFIVRGLSETTVDRREEQAPVTAA